MQALQPTCNVSREKHSKAAFLNTEVSHPCSALYGIQHLESSPELYVLRDKYTPPHRPHGDLYDSLARYDLVLLVPPAPSDEHIDMLSD